MCIRDRLISFAQNISTPINRVPSWRKRKTGNKYGILIQIVCRAQERNDMSTSELLIRPFRPSAVSYTHLDVYKRQAKWHTCVKQAA